MTPATAGKKSASDNFEETLIAAILGSMTLITFANVVVRYFGGTILWALEATVFLFAWLVLLGASYAVKTYAHLGVDVALTMLPRPVRRALGLIAVLCCLAYTLLLLKGSWDYWANYAGLPQTTGRWFPTGFETDYISNTWYEVNDIPMPAFMNPSFAEIFNEGEAYEKMPRLIPYVMLPISMVLLLVRFIQVTIRIAKGDQDMMIASHEAEEAVEEAAAKADRED